jgi:hypothetical protein
MGIRYSDRKIGATKAAPMCMKSLSLVIDEKLAGEGPQKMRGVLVTVQHYDILC